MSGRIEVTKTITTLETNLIQSSRFSGVVSKREMWITHKRLAASSKDAREADIVGGGLSQEESHREVLRVPVYGSPTSSQCAIDQDRPNPLERHNPKMIISVRTSTRREGNPALPRSAIPNDGIW